MTKPIDPVLNLMEIGGFQVKDNTKPKKSHAMIQCGGMTLFAQFPVVTQLPLPGN